MRKYKFISWGGGLQSTTMAVMSAFDDLPNVDAVVNIDPGFEWSKTYESINYYINWLSDHGVTAETKKADQNIKDNLVTNHIHIPLWTQNGGPLRRQCTKNFKLIPAKRRFREIAGYDQTSPPHPSPGEFEIWIGFTLDERERVAESRIKYMVNRWPLIEKGMTRGDCEKYLLSKGLPIPPKSACVICPYRRASEWVKIRDETPEEFRQAVDIDNQIRHAKPSDKITSDNLYLWQGKIPLNEVDFDVEVEKELARSKDKAHQLLLCSGGSCWT